jgi:hypothetical protein
MDERGYYALGIVGPAEGGYSCVGTDWGVEAVRSNLYV